MCVISTCTKHARNWVRGLAADRLLAPGEMHGPALALAISARSSQPVHAVMDGAFLPL